LYGQTNEPDKENNFIALPKEWNRSDLILGVTEPIRKGNRYAGCSSLVGCGVSIQSEASNLHDKVQKLYEQVDQPEMKGADMELAKVWKSQSTWNPMLCEKDHKFISRDEDGMSSVDEKTGIVTIKDEERVQKVVVKHEPRTCQFLTIQDGECDHTK